MAKIASGVVNEIMSVIITLKNKCTKDTHKI